jgi:hypothetical protein
MTPILEQPHVANNVHYIALNPEPVQRFLEQHPGVTQVLLDAKKPLQDAFGKDVKVSVTVTSNPEIAEGEFLVSSIQTSLSAMDAHARLDTFDETWWLDNVSRAEGQVIFTIAFP